MLFNKRSELFHSSLEKLPLVRMSASWFLVSTYLIWIFGSKLIRSNNQSRATVWVLVTCLMVGLLFYYHLDNRFVIFEDVQLGIALRVLCVAGHVIHVRQLINVTHASVASSWWMFSLVWLVNFGYLAPVARSYDRRFLVNLRWSWDNNVPRIWRRKTIHP